MNAGVGVFKDKERGVLDPKVFERAREVAEGLARGKLKSSQFRNYFAELRALENRFERERRKEGEELAFARLVPQLELLRAKLFYNTRSQGPLRTPRSSWSSWRRPSRRGSGAQRTLKR